MLLCGIIDELRQAPAEKTHLTDFFCQANDGLYNNATNVLRGILYILVAEKVSLFSHIEVEYRLAGKTWVQDVNTGFVQSKMLMNIFNDPNRGNMTIIIDALDECVKGQDFLLELITKASSYSLLKWIVSSCNLPFIDRKLDNTSNKANLCLEQNATHVSAAVRSFIKHKVNELKSQWEDNTKQHEVQRWLVAKADNTFLWVALICEELRKTHEWETLDILKDIPPGLKELYTRKMKKIEGLKQKSPEFCRTLLATVSIAYRPLGLEKLRALSGLPPIITKRSTAELVSMCDSFLTLQDEVVGFVHQSAKEFLLENAVAKMLPEGPSHQHYLIFSRSLGVMVMGGTLQRDMYNLRHPGRSVESITKNPPEKDLLSNARHSCIH